MWLGDFPEDFTAVACMFTTHADTGAPVAPLSAFEAADVVIFKNGSATEKTTTNGVTMTSPFNSTTGLHCVTIDTSNDTGDGGFWVAGAVYTLVLVPDETVDGVAVAKVIGQFGLELYGALRPTTLGRRLDVSTGGEAGIDWANIGSPTTAVNLSATNIDTDQVVASVSGAVGSVTGSVGGNVTGSVGSVATGGIAAASFASGAIDATAIAADAGTEIATAVWASGTRSLTVLDEDSTTLDLDATIRAAVGLASANLDTQIADIEGKVDDLETRLGTPSDLGSGATVAANLVDIEAQTDNLPAIETKIDTIDGIVDAILADTGTDGVVVASIANNAITAASIAADAGTEIGTAVWATAARTLTALDEDSTTLDLDATIRAAVGLASADLDTQLGALPTAAENADAVWEEAIDDHSGTAGSTAEQLAAAGAAGDPWATALPGAYSSGQAGHIVGTNLNATVSSRASQTSVDTIDGIVDSILDDTGTSGVVVASIANNAVTAAAVAADAGTEIATAVWASGTRTLTALDEDNTTLDLDATIRGAVGLASANLDTQLDALPTAAENATAVWGAGTRVLTALDEDTTTIDLDAAIRAAVGLASANLDTQIDALPTSSELTAALAGLNDLSAAEVNAEVDAALSDVGLTTTVTGRIDTTISSRLAGGSYTAPDNASITAIKARTDNLPTDPADASDIASSFGSVTSSLTTIAGYIDTEIGAIKAKTDLIPGTQDGYTFAELQILMASVLLGKATGLETTTAVYRALDDSKARITATVDTNGNRSAVTRDAA